MNFVAGQRLVSWVTPKAESRSSGIHGSGLCAIEPIARDEIVIVWGGVVISAGDFAAGAYKPDTACRLTENLYLADPPGSADADEFFLNHCCDSNLWMKDEITLTARRDIAVGEELTIDYSLWECRPDWVTGACGCGSMLCRGRVTGDDWKLPSLQQMYRGHFSPCVSNLIQASVRS